MRRTCSPGSRLSDSTELNFSSRFFCFIILWKKKSRGESLSLSLSESTRKDTNRRFSRFSRRRGQRREGGAGGGNAFLFSFSLSLSLRAAVCVVSFVFFFAVCAMRKIFKRPRPLLLASRPKKKQTKKFLLDSHSLTRKTLSSTNQLSVNSSLSLLTCLILALLHTRTPHKKKNKRGRPKKEKEKETLPLTT